MELAQSLSREQLIVTQGSSEKALPFQKETAWLVLLSTTGSFLRQPDERFTFPVIWTNDFILPKIDKDAAIKDLLAQIEQSSKSSISIRKTFRLGKFIDSITA